MASGLRPSLLVGPACGYDRAVSDAPCDVASFQGDWLSWLERAVHIREVTGSNPVSPTTVTSMEAGSARKIPRLSASFVVSTLTIRCEPRTPVPTMPVAARANQRVRRAVHHRRAGDRVRARLAGYRLGRPLRVVTVLAENSRERADRDLRRASRMYSRPCFAVAGARPASIAAPRGRHEPHSRRGGEPTLGFEPRTCCLRTASAQASQVPSLAAAR